MEGGVDVQLGSFAVVEAYDSYVTYCRETKVEKYRSFGSNIKYRKCK